MGSVSDSTPLTDGQEAFCQAYRILNNGTAAYIKAYPKSQFWKREAVHVRASELLALHKVSVRLAGLRNGTARKIGLTVTGQLQKLDRFSNFDPRKLVDENGKPIPLHLLDEDTAKGIQGLKVREIPQKDGTTIIQHEYKIPSRVAATDQENKHLGFYEADNAQKAIEIMLLAKVVAILPAEVAKMITEAVMPQITGDEGKG